MRKSWKRRIFAIPCFVIICNYCCFTESYLIVFRCIISSIFQLYIKLYNMVIVQLFLSLSHSPWKYFFFFFRSKLTRDFALYFSHLFILEVLTFKLSMSRPRRIKLLKYFNLTYRPIGMPCNVCNTFSYRNHGWRVIDFYLIYYSETCQNVLYYLFKKKKNNNNIILVDIMLKYIDCVMFLSIAINNNYSNGKS